MPRLDSLLFLNYNIDMRTIKKTEVFDTWLSKLKDEKGKAKITDFDPADYLNTKEAMIEYLNEALKTSIEDNTPEHFTEALGDITRAQGFTNVAKHTDLNREHLYRSLSKKGNPTFSTILKLLNFLGLEINIIDPQTAKPVYC